MNLIMINGKVYTDYRDNIIIDKDNPVLVSKAKRDRFSQKPYTGLARIGSVNSEDALVWNFTRSLSLLNDFSSLEDLLKISINSPKILLWTLSFDEKSNVLQDIVGSCIQEIDGKHQRKITEPDIIMETNDHFIVFECKLGEPNKYPGHLWEVTSDKQGPKIRHDDYFNNNPLFLGESGYDSNLYQLYRMVFYTDHIARKLNKKPYFVSLTNELWWNEKSKNSSSPKDLWEEFEKQIDLKRITMKNIFWQHISVADKGLGQYLKNHKCLARGT